MARPVPWWMCLKIPRNHADCSWWDMRQNRAHRHEEHDRIPQKGDRIERLQPRTGIQVLGTVFHVDQVQILVKWDDGRSGSLRPGVDHFRILDAA